ASTTRILAMAADRSALGEPATTRRAATRRPGAGFPPMVVPALLPDAAPATHNDCHADLAGSQPAALRAMSWAAAAYMWRASFRRSWQAALVVALIGGLLGAVALGALAGARRTASAYGRYLAAIRNSDAFVNVPGVLPGLPTARPMELISRLP